MVRKEYDIAVIIGIIGLILTIFAFLKLNIQEKFTLMGNLGILLITVCVLLLLRAPHLRAIFKSFKKKH